MLCKKALYDYLSLELNTQFDSKLRTESLLFSFFNSKTSSVG